MLALNNCINLQIYVTFFCFDTQYRKITEKLWEVMWNYGKLQKNYKELRENPVKLRKIMGNYPSPGNCPDKRQRTSYMQSIILMNQKCSLIWMIPLLLHSLSLNLFLPKTSMRATSNRVVGWSFLLTMYQSYFDCFRIGPDDHFPW